MCAFCQGRSAQTMQEEAEALQKDGHINKELLELPGLGSNGAWPQNAERDLHRLWKASSEIPHLEELFLPVPRYFKGSGNVKMSELAVLPLHETISALYHHSPCTFNRLLNPGPEALRPAGSLVGLWQQLCFMFIYISYSLVKAFMHIYTPHVFY